MFCEQGRQSIIPRLVAIVRKNIKSLLFVIFAYVDGIDLSLIKVGEQAVAIIGYGFERGQAGGEVFANSFAIGQQDAVCPPIDQAPCRTCFIGGCGGAVECRPTISITWVESIEDLVGEIVKPPLIKIVGIALADAEHLLALLRRHMRVDGIGGRREVVTFIATHLVKINHCQRKMLVQRYDPTLGLGLSQRQPVTI